ncbi:proteasome-interacting protein cic1 [Cryptotrichosporon argae]
MTAAAPSAALPASFSSAQAGKAVDALLAHAAKVRAEREETELIPRDEHVWLSVNTKQGTTRRSLKPVKIQLPHPPLPPPPATSVCLLSKDPQREFKDLLAAHDIKFVARVVGVDKLKGKFRPFEARRELMRDHDLFLCDERVLPLMPKLLGKIFFEAKKQPIPVNMLRKDLKAELGRAISSTYFHPSTGTSHSVRIATPLHLSSAELLANVLAAVPAVAALVPGGWDNVLSVGIKTSGSVLLPIWSAKLGGRFKGEAEGAGEAGVEGVGDVEMGEGKAVSKGKAGKKAEAKAETAKPKPKADKEKADDKPKAADKAKGDKAKPTPAGKAAPKDGRKKSATLGSGSVSKKAKAAALGRA